MRLIDADNRCSNCPHLYIRVQNGLVLTHCIYDDGVRENLIFMVDINKKHSPRNCPMKKLWERKEFISLHK